MLEFTYFGEIRGKGRPKFRRIQNFVSTYTPAVTRDYEASIKESFLAECKDKKMFFEGEQLVLELRIYKSIPKAFSKKKRLEALEGKIRPTKKPDIDNILKSVFDALNKVAYLDDTQIVKINVEKFYADRDYMKCRIYELEV